MPQQKRKTEQVKPQNNGTITVDMPMDVCFPGFATAYLDTRLTPRQATALKILWSSLSQRNARSKSKTSRNPNGQVVDNAPSAIRWLMDQLADGIEKKTGKDIVETYDQAYR